MTSVSFVADSSRMSCPQALLSLLSNSSAPVIESECYFDSFKDFCIYINQDAENRCTTIFQTIFNSCRYVELVKLAGYMPAQPHAYTAEFCRGQISQLVTCVQKVSASISPYFKELISLSLPAEERLLQILEVVRDYNTIVLLSPIHALPDVGTIKELHDRALLLEQVCPLASIEILALKGYRCTMMSNALTCFSNLKSLKLRRTAISVLPEALGALKKLQYLDLRCNKLVSIPDTVGDISSLVGLNFSENQLGTLPSTVSKLSALEELFVCNNMLRTLPQEIGALKQLRVLNVSNNKIEAMPPTVCNLSQLQEMILSSNELQEIPQNIGDLHKLQTFDISYNKIENLPDSLRLLQRLEECVLHHNVLHAVFDGFIDMKNLKMIELDANPIKNFPPYIGALRFCKGTYSMENSTSPISLL